MQLLVTYYSVTGRTARVAQSIYDFLPAEKAILPLEAVGEIPYADLVFIGFPVMQFGPPAPVKKLAPLFAGKKIALFITHALANENDDPKLSEMLEKEIGRCRSLFAGSEILGLFHCQGELAEQTANELISSGIPMLAEFGGMRSLTVGHPTKEELTRARSFAAEMMSVLGALI
jgi:hypothetical protein